MASLVSECETISSYSTAKWCYYIHADDTVSW